jgi:xylulokinase
VPLYLGLDSSTQSLTAIVIEFDDAMWRVVYESSLLFDEALPHFGTRHGVLPSTEAVVATSPPLMWAEALELMMRRLAGSGLDLSQLAAISGSAQQHGSVYLNASAAHILRTLDPSQPLGTQVPGIFAREDSPIWMDGSASEECREIADAVGGADVLAVRTGSRAFERFTGPQIRRFFKRSPGAYAATARIHLVSSFLASLLIGGDAPVDPGDGSGMNLMDLVSKTWWQNALDATAPGLLDKLPAIAPATVIAGTLSPYWQIRYNLPPARVITWSGDNPSSLIGTGLVREGRIAVSLGTSDTVFGLMKRPRVDATGTGHVFGAPTGDYMGLTCFLNGSLARERVRNDHAMDWTAFSRALDRTPPGAGILLPWFGHEITPAVAASGARRYGLRSNDAAGNVRALIDTQMMAMAHHSQWMGVHVDTIHATGGAAANRAILQTMANVFDADVYQLEVANSAALGAALRASHADLNFGGQHVNWDDVVSGLAEPAREGRLSPEPDRVAVYRELLPIYRACEAHAMGRRVDPSPLFERFRGRRP